MTKHTLGKALKVIALILTMAGMVNSVTATEYELKTVSGESASVEYLEALGVLDEHLKAIERRDLKALANTLSPDGRMQFILPDTEVMKTTQAFLDYHQKWFNEDSGWSMENSVISANVDKVLAEVVVQAMYSEPDRNGKPYFNRLFVSYTLRNIDGQWYIVKDHATSVERSPGY